MALPSIAALRAAFSYDPETGVIVWLKPTSNRAKAGERAGTIGTHGYYRIGFQKADHMAHRVAWALHTGNGRTG